MPGEAEPRRQALLVALIGLLACAVMLPTLGNDFTGDDRPIILDNPLVTSPGALPEIFSSAYWSSPRAAHDLYRPVTIASFWLNYQLCGPGPFSFHLVNLLLHALVSMLLAVTLERRLAPRAVALCAALLFAVHPVHAEPVASAVGRAELLAALCVLAAWLARARVFLCCAFYALGMMSKENAIVLPAFLLIEDLARRRPAVSPPPAASPRHSQWLRQYGPLLIVAVAYLVVRTVVLGPRIEAVEGPLHGVATGPRLLTAVSTFAHYLLLMIFPAKLTWHYWYDRVPLQTSLLGPWFLAGLVAIAGCLWVAWAARRRAPAISAGLALFMVALLPASNLVFPTGILMAERLLYLPSAGFCLAVGALIAAGGWVARRERAVRLSLLVVLVAACGMRSWRAARDWRDDTTVAAAAVAVAPRSGPAHAFLGTAHLRARRWGEAESEFGAALALLPSGTPDSAVAHAGLAATYLAQGRLIEAQTEFRASLDEMPDRGETHFNFGITLEALGRPQEAAAQYSEAVRLNAQDAQALNNLGRVLLGQGKAEEAVRVLRQAVGLRPGEVIPMANLAAALLAVGELDEAERLAQEILARDPDHTMARRIVEAVGSRRGPR